MLGGHVVSRLSGYFTVLATGTAVFLLLPLGLAAQTLSGRVTVLGEQLTEGGAVVTLLDSLSRPVEHCRKWQAIHLDE